MNLDTLTAGDVMSRDVATVAAHESLRVAARLLHARHIHCLVVPPDSAGGSAGVVTIKDIVQVLCDGEPAHLDRLLVKDAMTAPALSLQKDMNVRDCIKLMRMTGVRSAPVVEGTRLVGLISFSDVVRLVAGDAERREAE